MPLSPLVTLYEQASEPTTSLPPALAAAYDGGLLIPDGPVPTDTDERPYVIANFVESLDGVVSYAAPGQLAQTAQVGGGAISGESEPDHMVMGLLRARADAVIFGSGSLRADAGHVRVAAFVYPPFAEAYAALGQRLGRADPLPLNVVVSASGDLALSEPTFRYSGLRVVIATTPAGAARLAAQALPAGVEVRAVPAGADSAIGRGGVDPQQTLAMLARDYGVRVALHEGGPRLLASYLAADTLDELFLTLAPQLAGRSDAARRLALLEGIAFTPQTARWASLLSVKRAADHVLLRYRMVAR